MNVSAVVQVRLLMRSNGTVGLENRRYAAGVINPRDSFRASSTPMKAGPKPGQSARASSWNPAIPGVRRMLSISSL